MGPMDVENASAARPPVRNGLEVPYNWDIGLPSRLSAINSSPDTKYPAVDLYAADAYSITGSGRGGNVLKERREPVGEHIAEIHRCGMRFNYLFNAVSLNGLEFDENFLVRVLRQVEELALLNVDTVTVSHPRLARLIKENFPNIQLSASVNNHLDSVNRIKQLISFCGTDRIMLSYRAGRNFPLVREIRRNFPNHEIAVLVNESCLNDCVMQHYHQEYLGNISREQARDKATPTDWCHLFCAQEKLRDPVQCLKAPWLRPDDIKYMFDAGATLVKLSGRNQGSEWIIGIVEAYAKCHYVGDVFAFIEKSGLSSPEWETQLGKSLEPARFAIDNVSLNGFIAPFVEGRVPCVKDGNGCGTCRWCDKWVGAVTAPQNAAERANDVSILLENSSINLP